MRPRPVILVLVPLLAVGLASFVFVRSQQGQGATLVVRQQHAEALTPASIAAVVKAAPETAGGERGKRAACRSLGTGELRNPWLCRIRYSGGRVNQYEITINADGSYTGDHQVGYYRGHRYSSPATISGCCIAIP